MRIHTLVLSGSLFFASFSCPAQELSLLAGGLRVADAAHTYSWELDYRQSLSEHTAFSLSWLNEGHIPHHHRDGQGAQLWVQTRVLDPHLSLAVGIEPYFYYDTTGIGAQFSDKHGWGALSSLSATYYTDGGWVYQARLNHVVAINNFNSTALLAGIGYQLERPVVPGTSAVSPPQRGKTTTNQITVFLGQTIVNSFNSQRNTSRAIEFRHGVSPHIDWSLSWLNEGDARLIRRDGVIGQIWLVHDFFDKGLALGAGIGSYIGIDRYHAPQPAEAGNTTISAVVTATAAIRLSPHLYLRTSWNRIATTYNRDTDVIMMGLGYSF